MSDDTIRRVPDQVFATPDGVALLADLFLPARTGSAPLSPVIIWMHGGGFRIGDRRLAPDLSRYFAREGFAMVSIDYRLSHQAVFPAAVHDAKAAVRWVRSVAAQYGLDPERIGVWGSSAGGYLAAMVGALQDGELDGPSADHAGYSTRVKAAVVGYAPIDFLQIDADRPEIKTEADAESGAAGAQERSANADSRESLFMGAPINTIPERVRAANPITYLRPDAPPFLILHGLADAPMPWQQSQILFEALAANGSEATLCLVEGLGHAFLNSALDERAPHQMHVVHTSRGTTGSERQLSGALYPMIAAFFARHLGHAG